MRTVKQDVKRYAIGILAGIAALVLQRLLDPLLGSENPYHTAWAAVAFSAWYCGIGPALVTMLITQAGIWYWFLPPFNSFVLQSRAQAFGLFGFFAFSFLIMIIGEAARRSAARQELAEERLRRAHEELERRVQDRTAALEQSTAALEQKTAEAIEQANMLDLANDAIFVRSKTDTISYWNKGAERLYGWSKEETLGRSPHDLLHTEFPESLDDIKARDTWRGEIRHQKKDGTWIVVASRWTALRDRSGNPYGWLEINTDITMRKRAEEATRKLSVRLLTMQDEERRRIARALHDSLGQYLAALKMRLDTFPSPDKKQAAVASECADIVKQCLIETRTVSHLLHPPLLDESGLGSATRLYVDEFSRRSGVVVNIAIPRDLDRMDSELEIALFRAVQEGLTNVHRHAGASSVDIRLTKREGEIRLEIQDNGRGVPLDRLERLEQGAMGTGVGLAGMRERFRELGGNVSIKSGHAGTKLIITTPVHSRVSSS